MQARTRETSVADIMQPAPVSVHPETRVREALALMERYAIRHLPVVSDEVLVGFVSARDLAELSGPTLPHEEAREKLEWPLFRIMVEEVVTLRRDQSLREATRRFRERKVGAAPVVDSGNRVVGIVSTLDLLGELERLLE